jgi:hypothetical protein
LSSKFHRPEISVKPLQPLMAAAILSRVSILCEWSLQTQTTAICLLGYVLTEAKRTYSLIHVVHKNQTCAGEHIPYSQAADSAGTSL